MKTPRPDDLFCSSVSDGTSYGNAIENGQGPAFCKKIRINDFIDGRCRNVRPPRSFSRPLGDEKDDIPVAFSDSGLV
jgi:hypothetical protein